MILIIIVILILRIPTNNHNNNFALQDAGSDEEDPELYESLSKQRRLVKRSTEGGHRPTVVHGLCEA